MVTRRELLAGGLSIAAIRTMLQRGELQRLGRDAYLIGPRHHGWEGWRQRVAAAALAHPAGRVAGQAALALHQLDGFDQPVPIWIAVPPSSTGRGTTRRREALGPPVLIEGVRVAAIEEAMVDAGADLAPRPGCAAAAVELPATDLVELAVEAALRLGLTTFAAMVEAAEAAAQSRPGRRTLATVLQRRGDVTPTESYLETRCIQVLRDAGIVGFDRQVELFDERGFIGRVDLFRDGVAIETVGKAWHLPRYDADHARYARIAALGLVVLPFTFDHVEHDAGHVVRTTHRALVGRAA